MPEQNINLHPEETKKTSSILSGNKGLIIAAIVVLIVAVIGFSAFIGFGAADQYQGLIKKVETETELLKTRAR